MHHNALMQSLIHDALAFCRYEHDRCAHTVDVSKALRDVLFRRRTRLLLERSRNLRIRKKLLQAREVLAQQRRILAHGRTAKYLV